MRTKRVLLIESGCFIGGVIHYLFESNEEITAIEAQPQDCADLIDAVDFYRPDVIILDDTIKFDCLPGLLLHLQKRPSFRVIVVNTSANHFDIYQKIPVPVRQSSDLFAAI